MRYLLALMLLPGIAAAELPQQIPDTAIMENEEFLLQKIEYLDTVVSTVGITGATGATGPMGPAGADSTVPGPQGIQGIQGLQGIQGTAGGDGAAATVDVGSTTTGISGSSATVNNVGTSSAAVLSFTIPRGDKGETGAQGIQGLQGIQGTAGDPGEVQYASSGTFTGVSTFFNTGNVFYGDGSHLTGLPTSGIDRSSSGTWTGSNTYQSSVTFQNDIGLKTYSETISSITVSTSNYNISWSSGSIFWLTLSSSTTLSFSNAKVGESIVLHLSQNLGGSKMVTWPSIKWVSGSTPTLRTTDGRTDTVSILYDGTTYLGYAITIPLGAMLASTQTFTGQNTFTSTTTFTQPVVMSTMSIGLHYENVNTAGDGRYMKATCAQGYIVSGACANDKDSTRLLSSYFCYTGSVVYFECDYLGMASPANVGVQMVCGGIKWDNLPTRGCHY